MSTVTTTGSTASKAKREGSNWVERLARVGYAAKGVLYLLVGLLAARAAFDWGGQVDGSRAALEMLTGEGTFGTVLLWVIGIGLVGYTLWNAFRAAMDPENEGTDAKGIAKRIFFVVSAIIHGSLAIYIFTTLLGMGGGGGGGGSGDGTEDLVGRVLDWGTIGRLFIAIAGLCIAGFGIQQLVKAWKVDFGDMLKVNEMSEKTRKASVYTGRAGLAARGIVFVIVGWFFLQAAWQYSQNEAGGLGQALQSLGGYGPWVLGLVAIGLACYGVYMFIKARYRRIEPA